MYVYNIHTTCIQHAYIIYTTCIQHLYNMYTTYRLIQHVYNKKLHASCIIMIRTIYVRNDYNMHVQHEYNIYTICIQQIGLYNMYTT